MGLFYKLTGSFRVCNSGTVGGTGSDIRLATDRTRIIFSKGREKYSRFSESLSRLKSKRGQCPERSVP